MSEGRDPAIKLFGRKIPPQELQTPMEEGNGADSAPATEPPSGDQKDTCQGKSNIEAPKSMLGATVTAKANEKPDKVLPCPRCNSMDTKFCYYNNYNVNQPRHFCKNCQRYWTAGGLMRNVPVGAGRRKTKHTAPGYRHTAITPDALASVQVDAFDSIDRKSSSSLFRGNGTVLKFGPDAPLCESMASMLNLREQNLNLQLDFTSGADNGEETSSSSSYKPEENGITPLPHLQYIPGLPWANPWNPLISWNQIPPPFPFPFIPSPFWSWTCGTWNLPWLGNSNGASTPSFSTSTSNCSGNVSPTLGKHSREEEKTEKSLWIPKTLRIDDPDEAAKSSIFATLGIKLDEVTKFKAFSTKSGNGNGDGDDASKTTRVLHANPAALSRSQSFQEIAL